MSITNFLNFQTKETAYFLGFMWSDGYIKHYISKTGINNYKISLEINVDDAIIIESIMNTICDWAIYKRKRKESWKETWTFSKNNKIFYEFLKEYDYIDKSTCEPTKILILIPEEYKIYFWKGVIDGDGSIGLVGRGSYFELSSTYEYQYLELDIWLKSLNTFGTIYKQISKKGHKSSVYKIYGKKILPLANIIPKYGLIRKFDKFQQIIKKYEK
jgi:hypothetical protein